MSDPMRESPKALAAFRAYCALGEDRSLQKLADSNQKYAKSLPLLKRWSSTHHWQERVKHFDAERAAEKQRKLDDEREQMNIRHAMIGTTQQAKAIKQIEALIEAKKFGSQASVQLLKLATDLERLARGAPTEHTEVSGSLDVSGYKELLLDRLARLEGVTQDEP